MILIYQIVKLGGTAVIQPDTAITHVIYDSGRSAALLARDLGVSSLSELPEGTVCVKWEWVANCKLAVSYLSVSRLANNRGGSCQQISFSASSQRI